MREPKSVWAILETYGKRLMKGISVIAALGLVATSFAQAFDEPSNLAFRLGYVYPVDASLRDVSSSYIGVGLDLFPQGYSLLPQGKTVVSFDWIGKSGNGAKGNLFPILVNQRIYNDNGNSNAVAGRSYFQFGAGVAILDVINTKTVLAARVGYGKELGEKVFGEINFLYTDGSDGVRGTSLGFYLGYKF